MKPEVQLEIVNMKHQDHIVTDTPILILRPRMRLTNSLSRMIGRHLVVSAVVFKAVLFSSVASHAYCLSAFNQVSVQTSSESSQNKAARAHSRLIGLTEVLRDRYQGFGLDHIEADGRLLYSPTKATPLELRAAATLSSVLPRGHVLALVTHADKSISIPILDGVLYRWPQSARVDHDIEDLGSNVSIKSLELSRLHGNEIDRIASSLRRDARHLGRKIPLSEFIEPFNLTSEDLKPGPRKSTLEHWAQYSIMPRHAEAIKHQYRHMSGTRKAALNQRSRLFELIGQLFRLGRHQIHRGHTLIVSANTMNREQPTFFQVLRDNSFEFVIDLRQKLDDGTEAHGGATLDLVDLTQHLFAGSRNLDGMFLVSDLNVIWIERGLHPQVLDVPSTLPQLLGL